MKKVRRTGPALLLIILVATASMSGGAPAGADPSFIYRPGASMSPQYQVNGCRYRIVYLNYGSQPVAALRTYYSTAVACDGASVGVQAQNGATKYWYYYDSDDGYTEGIDSCGAYRNIQVVGPQNRWSIGALAALPTDSTLFDGWRFYGYDGTANQNAEFVQNCTV